MTNSPTNSPRLNIENKKLTVKGDIYYTKINRRNRQCQPTASLPILIVPIDLRSGFIGMQLITHSHSPEKCLLKQRQHVRALGQDQEYKP